MIASFSSAQSPDDEMKSGTSVRLAIDPPLTKAKVYLLHLDIPLLPLHRFEELSATFFQSGPTRPVGADRVCGSEHELVALEYILFHRIVCANPKRSVGHDLDCAKKLCGVAVIDEVFVGKIVEFVTERRERLLAGVANEAEAAEILHF